MSTIQSIRQFEPLRDDWNRLAARFATPLLEHDWLLSAARALHADGDLRVVCVHRDGRLVAAAPLALRRTAGGRRLALIGADALYEPGGLLFEDAAALAALLAAMMRLGHPLALSRVPADSPVCRAVGEWPRHRGLVVMRTTRAACSIAIDGDWQRYWSSLSRRITSNLPRLASKAARLFGTVASDVTRPAAADVDGLLDRFVGIEASGWKGRAGSALRDRPALQAFFRDYARAAAAAGRLRVTTVSFGGRLAAMELGLHAHGRIWQLKIGFDEQFAACYPGLLLVRASLQAAFEEAATSYEFLGSFEAWESRWATTTHDYRLVLIYPFTLTGMSGAWSDAMAKLQAAVGK